MNTGNAEVDGFAETPADGALTTDPSSPSQRFLAARGSMSGEITIADDFEWSEEELDRILDEPA